MLTRFWEHLGTGVFLLFAATGFGQPGTDPLLIEPSISPDNSSVLFASGGDLWLAPLNGGTARRISDGEYDERHPIFSPDGTRIAFLSTRTGGGDIYVLHLASSVVDRITYTEGPEFLDGWSRDGKWLYYSTTSSDIARMADVYRVSSHGGTPVPVLAERYFSEYFSAPSPSGDKIAVTAYGENYDRWWRSGHSYLDSSQIWIRDQNLKYSRLNPSSTAKELWPMWSPDGTRLNFVSDAGGAENLWVTRIGAGARQLTRFKSGRVLWPSISYDGKTIVFERDFTIWKLDTATGACGPVRVQMPSPTAPSKEKLDISSQIEEFAVSRYGDRVAFVSRGEVFLSPNPPDGTTSRITFTAGRELHLSWAPDGQRLVYTSLRTGAYRVFVYDTTAGAEELISAGTHQDMAPTWSPDGRRIAFLRDFRDICVYDTKDHSTRAVANGNFGPVPTPPRYSFARLLAWSPDGRNIAFISSGTNGFKNVWIVGTEGGEPHQVTTVATVVMNSVSWSPNSSSLVIDAALGSDTDGRQTLLIAKATTGTKWQVEILPIDVRAFYQHSLDAAGERIIFLGKAPDGDQVFAYDLRPPGRLRQVSTSLGLKRGLAYVPSRDEVWFLENGRIHHATLGLTSDQVFDARTELEADFAADKKAVFLEVWRYIADEFYDPQFHGIDWTAQKHRFEQFVERVQSRGELQRVLSLMLGELNSSHLVISVRARSGPTIRVGRLGLRFNALAQAQLGVLRVDEVVSGGPADQAGIRAGDIVLTVDDEKLTGNFNLDGYLADKIGRPVRLLIESGGIRKATVATTIGVTRERELLYDEWVAQKRAYVDRASNGKLSYVHLSDMGGGVIKKLAMELDASVYTRKGVVIDVRNNYGGAMDGHVLDVFSRKLYLKNIYRRFEVWQRHWYGQQALQLPSVLVTNRHTISDGECFVEGYRAASLGQVVGENTAGWVVDTGSTGLVDGSSMSLPTGRTVALNGADLERHPRRVDLEVIRAPGDSTSGEDNELAAAVRMLLKQRRVSSAVAK